MKTIDCIPKTMAGALPRPACSSGSCVNSASSDPVDPPKDGESEIFVKKEGNTETLWYWACDGGWQKFPIKEFKLCELSPAPPDTITGAPPQCATVNIPVCVSSPSGNLWESMLVPLGVLAKAMLTCADKSLDISADETTNRVKVCYTIGGDEKCDYFTIGDNLTLTKDQNGNPVLSGNIIQQVTEITQTLDCVNLIPTTFDPNAPGACADLNGIQVTQCGNILLKLCEENGGGLVWGTMPIIPLANLYDQAKYDLCVDDVWLPVAVQSGDCESCCEAQYKITFKQLWHLGATCFGKDPDNIYNITCSVPGCWQTFNDNTYIYSFTCLDEDGNVLEQCKPAMLKPCDLWQMIKAACKVEDDPCELRKQMQLCPPNINDGFYAASGGAGGGICLFTTNNTGATGMWRGRDGAVFSANVNAPFVANPSAVTVSPAGSAGYLQATFTNKSDIPMDLIVDCTGQFFVTESTTADQIMLVRKVSDKLDEPMPSAGPYESGTIKTAYPLYVQADGVIYNGQIPTAGEANANIRRTQWVSSAYATAEKGYADTQFGQLTYANIAPGESKTIYGQWWVFYVTAGPSTDAILLHGNISCEGKFVPHMITA